MPENQCIFIRGFRVKRIFGIFPRLKGAAEPRPDPRLDDREQEMQVVPIPNVTQVDLLFFEVLVLIYGFKVPGSAARTIRIYRERESNRSILRLHCIIPFFLS